MLFAVIVTVVLRFLPFGQTALYPFAILGTWFHEMGHGLTALILGGGFKTLEIFPSGSGVALTAIPEGNRWIAAAVSAGGLLAPSIAGAILILFGRWPAASRYGLILLTLLMITSLVIWVRGDIGMIIVGSISALLLFVAWKTDKEFCTFVIQFLGAQAALSSWSQWDYLFTEYANINGEQMLSDTGSIAQQLGGSYALWGGLIGGFSALILILTFWLAYRR